MEQDALLYPNPAASFTNIEVLSNTKTIWISDMNQTKLFQIQPGPESKFITFDIGSLLPGTYIVTWMSDKALLKTEKLVKL